VGASVFHATFWYSNKIIGLDGKPARRSRSAAADGPDSDRKQKIATCSLVAHLLIKNKP
jgi:hypothetical protein